ncbi:RNA polymerase sigma factor [Actinomadura madurae]|uniref:RNA polymerase sigma factor n=1 Tax=Actinomadura madurae TaxID=1993 RepID=UPI0020263D45|nr:RNA polymerase sigma factor [Actinomadura madurae]MCP9947698.1 RNA polymerase sigma factor [Actinomadura madurae]URM93359.1 RNA polymerase sigma factor [Actinomadura madurae]URN04094.1 RNA polymerase sigma factor [Actinomadura madurae]
MTVTDEALAHTPPDTGAGTGPGAGGDGAAGEVVAALADDLDAGFAVLYEAYRGAVFSTALRLCGRWAEAEDLSAEAFLRAYRALAGYEADRIAELRPRAWLLTILTNVWRNGLRTAARRPPPGPIEDAPDPPDPGEGVEDAVARHETGRELAALLAELPWSQRAAVVLRHVTDLPVAEIAVILDVPEGTVKSHISRGLARLRRLRTAQPPASGPPASDPPTSGPAAGHHSDPPQKGGIR